MKTRKVKPREVDYMTVRRVNGGRYTWSLVMVRRGTRGDNYIFSDNEYDTAIIATVDMMARAVKEGLL